MTRLTSWNLNPLSALALLFVVPVFVEGQVVRGRLLDFESGQPIPAGEVTLLLGPEGNQVARRALSDSLGAFVLEAKGESRFRLRAERIGYMRVTSPAFDLVPPDTLGVELTMAVNAIPLAPLEVVSKREPLLLSRNYEIAGFHDREYWYGPDGLGMGTFLVRKDWEHRSPTLFSQLLRGVKGVRVHRGEILLRSVTGWGGVGCRPEFYLDGQHVRMLVEVTHPEPNKRVIFRDQIDDLISPASIAAVEVYHGISRPAQYMDLGDMPCGAIVLWSG